MLGKLAAQLKGSRVVTGILGSTAARPGEEIDNVGLGVVHEFGLGVPERSFLRSTFDKQKDHWYRLTHRLLRATSRGKLELETAMRLIGEQMKADVKKSITSGAGVPPPNAPSTIARKGSSRPLVDSARLVGSIDYEVRSPGG